MEVDEIGELNHIRAIATYDPNGLRSAPPQCRDLSFDQRFASELDEAFRALVIGRMVEKRPFQPTPFNPYPGVESWQ